MDFFFLNLQSIKSKDWITQRNKRFLTVVSLSFGAGETTIRRVVNVPEGHLEDYLTTASVLTIEEKMLCAHIIIHNHNQILIPFQNLKWCCILLGILVITLGGLISRRHMSTLSILFPQYHLRPLCFELTQRPTSCLTTLRYTQCIVSIPIPLTMSKLGSLSRGLGALKPQTYQINMNVSILFKMYCYFQIKMRIVVRRRL